MVAPKKYGKYKVLQHSDNSPLGYHLQLSVLPEKGINKSAGEGTLFLIETTQAGVYIVALGRNGQRIVKKDNPYIQTPIGSDHINCNILGSVVKLLDEWVQGVALTNVKYQTGGLIYKLVGPAKIEIMKALGIDSNYLKFYFCSR